MSTFTVTRSLVMAAPADTVFGLVNDFREWRHWSPWEGLDPHLQRDYAGPSSGAGAAYSWAGNRKAGAGRMEITATVPGGRVEIDLHFLRPFRADNRVVFDIETFEPDLVRMTWTMTGRQNGLMAVLGKVMPMDRIAGRDFEKGLAQLKLRAENR